MVVTPSWGIEFYETDDNRCPVQDFLDGLDKPRRAKVMALIALLGEQGPTLPFPYSSQVRGKIRELRTQYGKEREEQREAPGARHQDRRGAHEALP